MPKKNPGVGGGSPSVVRFFELLKNLRFRFFKYFKIKRTASSRSLKQFQNQKKHRLVHKWVDLYIPGLITGGYLSKELPKTGGFFFSSFWEGVGRGRFGFANLIWPLSLPLGLERHLGYSRGSKTIYLFIYLLFKITRSIIIMSWLDQYFIYLFSNFPIFQFCDVAQVAIIHNNIEPNWAIFKIWKVEKSQAPIFM